MKRALVTGGSGAIGAAISSRLARSGHFVYVHANQHLARAEAVVEALRAEGFAAEAVSFDVCDGAATAIALQGLLAVGPIQVLVNNAGIHDDAVFPGMQRKQWERVIDVSLNGFFNVTQPLTMPMLRTRFGRIVNISSVAGVMGNRGQVNYAAAKAALHGATKALSLELASRNVTVNAVAPGFIATAMTEVLSGTQKEAILGRVPAGRLGTPDDVAASVLYLASSEASYVTGQTLHVNGGLVMN